MTFADEKKRDNYLIDPQHLEVAQRIIPLLEKGAESIIAFDYFTSIPSGKLLTLTNSSIFASKTENDIIEDKPTTKPTMN